jgi:hypothetical protein
MTRLLMKVERWIADHPAVAKRAEGLLYRLAAHRLNGVVDGLLTSIHWQVVAGSMDVIVGNAQKTGTATATLVRALRDLATADVGTKGEGRFTEVADRLEQLQATVEHARAALGVIDLFVYNELKQRGKLGAIALEGTTVKIVADTDG